MLRGGLFSVRRIFIANDSFGLTTIFELYRNFPGTSNMGCSVLFSV